MSPMEMGQCIPLRSFDPRFPLDHEHHVLTFLPVPSSADWVACEALRKPTIPFISIEYYFKTKSHSSFAGLL